MKDQEEVIKLRKLSQQYAYTSLQMHESIGRKAGLSGTDHKYLGFLIQEGSMTAGELSVLTGLTTGAVTGLIDRFIKKKLVKRQSDKDDRRKIIIVPDTEKILALLQPFYIDFQDNTDQLIAAFSSEERKTLEKYFMNALRIMNEKILTINTDKMNEKGNSTDQDQGTKIFYHGTRADLKSGDLIEAGFNSNYGDNKKAKYIYLTETLDAAIWGAELATGEGRERIYIVEPAGPIEDDPNLTDKKFPGNPTKSYRSKHPFKVIGEVKKWQSHSAAQLKTMKDNLERLKQMGIEAIED